MEPNNPKALRDMIEEIVTRPNGIVEKGNKALEVAKEVFAKPVVLEQYNQFFENL